MRLRERILREENKEPDDPLDLMIIGQHAYMEEDDTREDPLYEWLRSEDLDGQNGEPAGVIAQEASAQGVDIEGVLQRERTPEDTFDPLSRSQTQSNVRGASQVSVQALSTSSSSRTKSGDNEIRSGGDDDDDDDDTDSGGESGGGDIGGGDSSYPQSQRSYIPFTCEEAYTHATQDEDHGARSPIKQYERRSRSRKGKEPVEDNTLTSSMASVDLSDSKEESSYEPTNRSQLYPFEWSEDSGWNYNNLSYPSSQPSQPNSASDYIQPYGYTSSDYPNSGVDPLVSYSLFTFPLPHEYEPT